jgi:tight adherence protein B
MGAFCGLIAGLGLLLVWQSTTRPRSVRADRAHAVPPLKRWTRHRQSLLRQAGVSHVGPWQLLAAQAALALLCAVAVLVLTAALTVAACFAVFGFLAFPALLRRQRRARARSVRELWPDVVDNLASAVRAGLALPEAMIGLEGTAPAELAPVFAEFAANYRASGRFELCLDALKSELGDPVADLVCETMRIAREVGGTDLGSVLRSLAELLRADARTRSELETRQGWTVNAARLAVAAPWLVLLLFGTQSATLTAFDSGGGALVLAGGAGTCVVAYCLMLRIGQLPEPKRVMT